MVRIAAPHGHGKSAADHIPQDIIEDNIGAKKIIDTDFIHLLKGSDDSAACTALAGKRSSRFGAENACRSGLHDLLCGKGLPGPDVIHDRKGVTLPHSPDQGGYVKVPVCCFFAACPQEPCGIRLGITADLQHSEAPLRQGNGEI